MVSMSARGSQFEFTTAGRIVFGAGTLATAAPAASKMGRRALLVTGSSIARAEPLLRSLRAQGIEVITFSVDREPTTHLVEAAVESARDGECDLVIGFGGGSVLDTGKAVAILLTNGGRPLDYMEVIGQGRPFTRPAAPFIAIPTTAGTGTEVTRNAVLASPEYRVKVSLRGEWLLPRMAIIDPALTTSLPPAVTASTGLDALAQLIEPYVSVRANPLTDAICLAGIRRAARSLRRAFEQGDDMVAREDMSLASLFGGLALANAKLGAVHGFAGVLGGMLHAPHGAICGRLLPHVLAVNVGVLKAREPESDFLRRHDDVARALTGNPDATADEALAWVEALCNVLNVPPLSAHGMTRTEFPSAIEKTAVSSSMKGNPVALSRDEMEQILTLAL